MDVSGLSFCGTKHSPYKDKQGDGPSSNPVHVQSKRQYGRTLCRLFTYRNTKKDCRLLQCVSENEITEMEMQTGRFPPTDFHPSNPPAGPGIAAGRTRRTHARRVILTIQATSPRI